MLVRADGVIEALSRVMLRAMRHRIARSQ